MKLETRVWTLDELILANKVKLGRGDIISKKDSASFPGEFPIYSSAREKNGTFGFYGKYMFDEELITWSIDGGGRLFYRPRHKFSVTNVGGTLRILDADFLDCRYLHLVLTHLHSKIVFDWVRKAHPSVIRMVYNEIPIPSLEKQHEIVEMLNRAFIEIDTLERNLEFIEENASDKKFLITSRIDNDDCIHKDFINEIQKQFNEQDFLAIDTINGYTLQVEPSFILGKKEHIFNPFISLIERNDNPKTVWHYVHNMWKKEPRLIHLTEKRLWLSIIHGKNKVNEFDGYGNIKWNDINSDFVISESKNSKILTTQLPFSKWWFLSLKNCLYVKMVLGSKQIKKMLGIYKVK